MRNSILVLETTYICLYMCLYELFPQHKLILNAHWTRLHILINTFFYYIDTLFYWFCKQNVSSNTDLKLFVLTCCLFNVYLGSCSSLLYVVHCLYVYFREKQNDSFFLNLMFINFRCVKCTNNTHTIWYLLYAKVD